MFSRTALGIRNTPLFQNGYYIVIVEGSSDVSFWSNFFPEEVNGYKRKLKPVGGRLEVRKYIDEILSSEAKFAVAIDSDYRLLLNQLHNHSRIVETEHHSIENLMLSSSAIASIIRNLCHDPEYEVLSVDTWLDYFDTATHSLMIADLLIEKNNLGKQCVGDNCFPFLIKKNNPTFDPTKINSLISNLGLPQQEFLKTSKKLRQARARFHIRGHFFFSAALCFVSHEVKTIRKTSISLSNESFFALLTTLCKSRISEDSMLQAIRNQALLAAEEVTNFLSQGY